jgi:hypothetical protein
VRLRGYIEKGMVLSLTSYFEAPKTKFNICLVYDASRCGLNDAVWALVFFNPLVDAMLDVLDANSWMGDIDLSEIFLKLSSGREGLSIRVSWFYAILGTLG